MPWVRFGTTIEEEGAFVVCFERYESDKFYFLRVLYSDFFMCLRNGNILSHIKKKYFYTALHSQTTSEVF